MLVTKELSYEDLDTPEVTPVSADYLCVSCSSSKQLRLRCCKTHLRTGSHLNQPHPPLQKILCKVSGLRIAVLADKTKQVTRYRVVVVSRVVSARIMLTWIYLGEIS